MEMVVTGVLAGAVAGTFVTERHLVTHPDGHANHHGRHRRHGHDPCDAGTFTIGFVGTTDANRNVAGRSTTIRDSSNTANFRTNVEIVGGLAGITYSGGYHCH